MTARAALILTGLAAAAAAVLIMTTRSADSPSRPGPAPLSTAAADRAPSPERIVQPRPVRPTLSAPGSDRARPSLATGSSWTAFEDEKRDPSWAPAHEQAVRDKLAKLVAASGAKVEVDGVECRSHQCRFEVDGGEASTFQQFVETLQGDDGFQGDATQLLLQNYRPAGEDGGQAKVQVVLRYGRGDHDADPPEPKRPE